MYHESKGVGSTISVETGGRTLEGILSKLVSIPDVSGAAILRGDGSVVSWRTKNGEKPTQDIDFINGPISAAYKKNIHYWKSGLFTESILEYNGHKILLSRIREDVMVLLLVDKKAYLGLTMLDLEGCLREVDKTLDENCSKVLKAPG
jgi:predicted regulator of Ras-like GTPase activity (Roadblock/LC7/MglB family)